MRKSHRRLVFRFGTVMSRLSCGRERLRRILKGTS